jgi:hypothetical protein
MFLIWGATDRLPLYAKPVPKVTPKVTPLKRVKPVNPRQKEPCVLMEEGRFNMVEIVVKTDV